MKKNILAALLISFQCTKAQICFSPAINLQADSLPYFVISADFNNDGFLDIATPNDRTDNVSVMLGTGTGSFGSTTYFPASSGPICITTADFNGDGNLDLAVADGGSDEVSILIGDGTGNFAAAVNYATGGMGTSGLTNGEFNGDTKIDLAVINYDAGNVSIFLGDGLGGFAVQTPFPASQAFNPGPNAVISNDFNLDGKADLAIANWDNSDISLFLGIGNGTFSTPASLPCHLKPCGVISDDFNSDSKPDLAASNYFSNDVSVLLGNGTGGFGTAANFPVGSQPYSLASADFNLDGFEDIVANNESGNSVSVLLGDGSGSFGAMANFAVGLYPESVCSGDFNLDGKPDLAVANYHSNTVSILLNTILPTVTANASADTVCAGDMVTLYGSGVQSYAWTGGVTNGVAFAASATTTYIVTGTNTGGCTNKDTVTIHVNGCTALQKNKIATLGNVYPNPARDILFTRSSNDENEIKIMDVLGNSIASSCAIETNSTGEKILSVNVSDLQNGIYFLLVTSGKTSSVQKFSVAR